MFDRLKKQEGEEMVEEKPSEESKIESTDNSDSASFLDSSSQIG